VGGKILTVVELDPLAQMEAPAGRLEHLPALRETGDDLELGAALGQALVDIAEHAEREGLVEGVRVERLEVTLEAEAEGRRVRRPRGGEHGDREREKRRLDVHLSPLWMVSAAAARPGPGPSPGSIATGGPNGPENWRAGDIGPDRGKHPLTSVIPQAAIAVAAAHTTS